MKLMDGESEAKIERRNFLKNGLLFGGLFVAAPLSQAMAQGYWQPQPQQPQLPPQQPPVPGEAPVQQPQMPGTYGPGVYTQPFYGTGVYGSVYFGTGYYGTGYYGN